MSDDLSSKTVLIRDWGNYTELGIRLAREFGRVLYFKPWADTAPRTQDLLVGDGYDEMERVRDFWDAVHKSDLVVYPDIYDADEQLEVERQGVRVWGSRKAEQFEYERGLFAETCAEVGLPVPKFKKIVGVSRLREYLSENDDQWIKVKMRGDRETWHHENIKLSEPTLDAIAYYYGPVKEMVHFYVFDSLDSKVEMAYDGYMVTSPDGKPQFPQKALLGYERKNKAHILTPVDYDDLPEQVRIVNDKFAPKLAEFNFRSQWGTEIIDEYFLDATARSPSPPGEIVYELVTNLGEIMWHGSVGELVEMDLAADFAVQVMLYSAWAGSNHLPVEIPKKIRQWVKLGDNYRANGIDWIIPKEVEDPISGWTKNCGAVVALGSSIKEAIETAIERCAQIKSIDTETQVSALAEILNRIVAGEEQGIPFAEEIPSPEIALSES